MSTQTSSQRMLARTSLRLAQFDFLSHGAFQTDTGIPARCRGSQSLVLCRNASLVAP
jgi:hypothetical protein